MNDEVAGMQIPVNTCSRWQLLIVGWLLSCLRTVYPILIAGGAIGLGVEKMKTVFLVIFNGFAARYLLYTDILKTLARRAGQLTIDVLKALSNQITEVLASVKSLKAMAA